MKKYFAMILVSMTLVGCAGVKIFPDWPATPARKSEQNYSEKEYLKVTPQQTVCPKCGAVVVVSPPQIEKSYERTLQATQPPQTFFDRIRAAIGMLGFWGTLLLIGTVILLGPGPIIGFLWARYRKWKSGMIETVQAIKDSKAVDRDAELHNALKHRQTPSTAKMVNSIRATL